MFGSGYEARINRKVQEQAKSLDYRNEELESEIKNLRLVMLQDNSNLVDLGRNEVLDIIASAASPENHNRNISISTRRLLSTPEGDRVYREINKLLEEKKEKSGRLQKAERTYQEIIKLSEKRKNGQT
jgi:hypothetical protein